MGEKGGDPLRKSTRNVIKKAAAKKTTTSPIAAPVKKAVSTAGGSRAKAAIAETTRAKKTSASEKAVEPVPFADKSSWAVWLERNHQTGREIWIAFGKKGSPTPSVTYHEALDVALTYGWIDGQRGSIDAHWFKQRFTPRNPRSMWSKINRDKATALIESGEMRPAGLYEVQRAQADGRWDAAYDSARTASVPDDLAAALAAKPKAAKVFAALNATNRYAALYRVQTAKRPETRAKKIAELVEKFDRGEVVS